MILAVSDVTVSVTIFSDNILLHFHNKDLIQFQTFSSQSKIRIRAFILMKCILGFVLFKWKLLNHNLEQNACRNGTYFMFLRPYRIMLLLGCKQSKNLQKWTNLLSCKMPNALWSLRYDFGKIARRVYVSILLHGTYFTPRNENFQQNATVRA